MLVLVAVAILTYSSLVYFAEKDLDDRSLPFKWGHGTSIASSVVFLLGALASVSLAR